MVDELLNIVVQFFLEINPLLCCNSFERALSINMKNKSKKLSSLDYASTHRQIIEDCKRGCQQSQFKLYRLYSKAMYNTCLRMVKSQPDAEDILQESFMDVFGKLSTFQYQSSIGAWIKRIVINNCINHLKRKRLLIVELNDGHYNQYEPIIENDLSLKAYNVDMVRKAIMQLPNGYRVVFSLYALEGYDHKEIAQILGVSEATSKSQYSRAKVKLKEIVKKQTKSSFVNVERVA